MGFKRPESSRVLDQDRFRSSVGHGDNPPVLCDLRSHHFLLGLVVLAEAGRFVEDRSAAAAPTANWRVPVSHHVVLIDPLDHVREVTAQQW